MRRQLQRKGSSKRLHLENVDIRDLLEEINVFYSESSKNVSQGWIGVRCPFCDDNSDHLGINVRQKTISCWKCGETGTILKYLTREVGSFNQALQLVQKYIPRQLILEKEIKRSGVSEVLLPDKALPGLSIYHKNYLKKRGFNPDLLSDKYNLHYVGPVGDFRNRIIVPVLRHYRLVTFTSVDIADETIIRYQHLEDDLSIIPVKQLLYNSETSNGNSVMVVEGLFDCWRLGDGATPTWGVKFTAEQVRLLAKYHYVKMIGDGDKDGWKFNKNLASLLSAFSKVKYFELESGIDPDKLTEEEIEYIRRS